ncbi:hypothetical protein [Metaclostridioides mangenotii]|uniref:Uncharacterized protein n=1 Tax=Metaclostridioides mangenotii TaxID=1540 RepID=A0ABS4E8A0_9FIRM|nr:hypothetical protein [Clostridioides mangenotii]MBP1854154.1 hypothetical protein [Clostridioides mangenotii]
MSLKVDRNILQWFDRFFEEGSTTLRQHNFLSNLSQNNVYNKNNVAFTLKKSNSNYWKLYFELSNDYIIKLRQNVHPLFREYIYEQISIYNNSQIYNFINTNILRVFKNVSNYEYDYIENIYVIDYSQKFLEKCENLLVGESRFLTNDLYINADKKDSIDFFNGDKSFILTLQFNPDNNENLLDSLLDLRKSIIINEKN